jgi:elongation factor G
MANQQSIQDGRERSGPKGGRRLAVAIVGPFQSGKTTLLEALLARTGAISRAGQVAGGSSVGDASAEARAHQMSVEPNIASAQYLSDHFTFIDCPGSVEFLHDMRAALPLCDAAVVVCEADSRKIPALQVILHELEDMGIPRFLFLNKIDTATARVRETLALLQPASRTPLLLRQIPIWRNGAAEGYVDLASERAYIYRENAESRRTDIPGEEVNREKEARFSMLERLADYDDALMEALLTDAEPPRQQVYADLAQELAAGHVTPVLIGSASRGNGVTRLLKALRHEVPGLEATRARLGLTPSDQPLAQVIRTIHTAHGGKLSVARVLSGVFADNDTVAVSGGGEERITGISRMVGQGLLRIPEARAGDCLAFGRLDGVATGGAIGLARSRPHPAMRVGAPEPVMTLVLHAPDRKDDVKLSAALQKLADEDPALRFAQAADGGEMTLGGQGEMHLRVALARIRQRFGIAVGEGRAPIAYRETIRDEVTARGRHKKQSGGHGQFGDCVVTVRPLERGAGVQFRETVTGGAVPRQYIPAAEGAARLPRGGRRGGVVGRQLPFRRFLRHGVPDRRTHRRRRGAAEGPSGAAGAGSGRRSGCAHGCYRPGDAARLLTARADTRFRPQGRVERLGGRAGAGAGRRNGGADRRVALRHGRRRLLHPSVRPPRRDQRQAGRPRGDGTQASAGGLSCTKAAPRDGFRMFG